MELDVLEVFLCHGEHVTRIGQEDITPFLVLGHILILTLLEILQLLLVVTLYPAGFVKMDRFPAALGIILVFQTILDNLKLQLAHGSDNLAAIELIDKQLCHALVHQLVDAFLQLLGLHRVVVLDVLEQLWREAGETTEM